MKPLLERLWTDTDYLTKTCVILLGIVVSVLPNLPLGDTGIPYWIKQFGLPILIGIGATLKSGTSGITADEAAKLRALIPVQDVLDKRAPALKAPDA
jgi:hypothetical protein